MNAFVKIAFRNIWKNKRRSLSTGLAIAAGFVALCLLGGYIIRSEIFLRVIAVYVNHTGHLAIYKTGGVDSFSNNPRKFQIPGEELLKIQALLAEERNVEFSAPILQGMGLISSGDKSVPFLGYGVSPSDEMRIQTHPQVKSHAWELVPPADKLSIKDAHGELADTISITSQLAILLGRRGPLESLSAEDRDVQLAARTFEGDLNAVNANLGFQHTTGYAMLEDTGLVAPLPLLRSLYATDGATYLAVYLDPKSSISSMQKIIQQKLLDANLSYEVIPFNDDRIGLFYVGTIGFLYIMAGFFVVLIFGAVALSIINSLTIGILERVREIGTLRAIGFTNRQTAWLFTLEAVFLTFISLVLGFVVTKVLAAVINSLNLRFNAPGLTGDMQFYITPENWFCFLLSLPILLLCLVCAYAVSKKQVNKPIIQLLQQAN